MILNCSRDHHVSEAVGHYVDIAKALGRPKFSQNLRNRGCRYEGVDDVSVIVGANPLEKTGERVPLAVVSVPTDADMPPARSTPEHAFKDFAVSSPGCQQVVIIAMHEHKGLVAVVGERAGWIDL